MDEKNNFKGIWIPADILKMGKLNSTDKMVVSMLISLSKDGYAWASNKYLSEIMGMPISTIKYSLCRLEKAGLIQKDIERKTFRKIFVPICKPSQKLATPSQKLATPSQKLATPQPKIGHNNIYIEYTYKNNNVADGGGEKSEVIKAYQGNIHPLVSQMEADKLLVLVDDFGAKTVIKAIERAVLRNKRNLGYITGILENWQTNGYDEAGSRPKKKESRADRIQREEEEALRIAREFDRQHESGDRNEDSDAIFGLLPK